VGNEVEQSNADPFYHSGSEIDAACINHMAASN